MHQGARRAEEQLQHEKYPLVHHWLSDAAGLRHHAPVAVHASAGRQLVVLHSHPRLLVHRQLGRLSHRRAHGQPD